MKTRKIRCYINGEYCFTTTKFSSQKALKNHLRSVKHIEIASILMKYITIYDMLLYVVPYMTRKRKPWKATDAIARAKLSCQTAARQRQRVILARKI